MCLPAGLGSVCTICFRPAGRLNAPNSSVSRAGKSPVSASPWPLPTKPNLARLQPTGRGKSNRRPCRANFDARTLLEQGKAKTIVLEDVLKRNVWLLGGLIKMESPISKIENGALEVASKFLKTFYE